MNIHQSYPKHLISEAIVHSLRASATDFIGYLDPHVTVDQMLEKLKMTYGTVAGYDVLMQNVHGMNQVKAEKVQVFATRLEGSLNQICVQFLNLLSDHEMQNHLRDRYFYGVHKVLDSSRYMYDDPSISHTQLLVALQKAKQKF